MGVQIFVPKGKDLKFDSAQTRIKNVRATFDHLPAWRCDSFTKGRFYLCGRCFGMRGNGPATNGAEMWMAGAPGGEVVPADARCEQCGGRAWPSD